MDSNKIIILFFHQSADLYGSDKNILVLAKALLDTKFYPIVCLPCHGPLERYLIESSIEYHVIPLIKISRSSLSINGIIKLLISFMSNGDDFSDILRGRLVSIVHTNTLAMFSGYIFAHKNKIPHLWNVREMIVKPSFVRYFFGFLLSKFSDVIVANSYATLNCLSDVIPSVRDKSEVIWNGVDRDYPPALDKIQSDRKSLGINPDEVCVAMVGRINRWKGQSVFVQAASHLWSLGIRKVRYLIVGSPPSGQGFFEDNLRTEIELSPARNNISIVGFRSDIWSIWDLCDVAVVPSTEPEPFGMVAIEAMLAGKPVIASDHGGLSEIIVSGITGDLVKPKCSISLANSLLKFIDNNQLITLYGNAGRIRAIELFSNNNVVSKFISVYENMLR